MTKSISEQLKELQLNMLQLQRSALIDTQTLFQLMIDKGVCDVEDIVSTRTRVETDNEAILNIDEQIEHCGGTVSPTPVPDSIAAKEDLKAQLIELISQLGDPDNNDSSNLL